MSPRSSESKSAMTKQRRDRERKRHIERNSAREMKMSTGFDDDEDVDNDDNDGRSVIDMLTEHGEHGKLEEQIEKALTAAGVLNMFKTMRSNITVNLPGTVHRRSRFRAAHVKSTAQRWSEPFLNRRVTVTGDSREQQAQVDSPQQYRQSARSLDSQLTTYQTHAEKADVGQDISACVSLDQDEEEYNDVENEQNNELDAQAAYTTQYIKQDAEEGSAKQRPDKYKDQETDESGRSISSNNTIFPPAEDKNKSSIQIDVLETEIDRVNIGSDAGVNNNSNKHPNKLQIEKSFSRTRTSSLEISSDKFSSSFSSFSHSDFTTATGNGAAIADVGPGMMWEESMGELFTDAMLAMLPAEVQRAMAAESEAENSKQRLFGDRLKERLEEVACDAEQELSSGFGTGSSHWRDAILHRTVIDSLDVAEQILINFNDDFLEKSSMIYSVLSMITSVLNSAVTGLENMNHERNQSSFFLERAAHIESCLGTILDVVEQAENFLKLTPWFQQNEFGEGIMSSQLYKVPDDIILGCERLLLQWIHNTGSLAGESVFTTCQEATNVWLSTIIRHTIAILNWFIKFQKVGWVQNWNSTISDPHITRGHHTIKIAILPVRDLLTAASKELETRGKNSNNYSTFDPEWLSSLTTLIPPSVIIHQQDINIDSTRSLGTGSFGKVMASQWFGSQIALKTFYFDGESQKAMDNELRMMLNFRHPKIVSFLGVIMEPSSDFSALPVLAMECLPMGSLFDGLHDIRNLPPEKLKKKASAFNLKVWRRRLWIAYDIASALSYLHTHSRPGFVHRDIRSANVLIDSSIRGKLSDFSTTHESGQACPIEFIPDPKYMPPEVLDAPEDKVVQLNEVRTAEEVDSDSGNKRVEVYVTTSADVFSYGVLLWELVTGCTPWEGANWAFVTRCIAEGKRLQFPKDVDTADKSNFHLPDCITDRDITDIESIAHSCWKHNPEERPEITNISNTIRDILLSNQRRDSTERH